MMTSADDAYTDMLYTLARSGKTQGESCMLYDQHLEFSPNITLLPSDAGNDMQRWSRFVFQYIEPRSFERFLAFKPSHRVVGYTFPVFAMHNRGNCILGVTMRKGLLTAYSRTCLWAPTGMMDIHLLCAIAKHFGIDRVSWHLSSVYLHAVKSYVAFAKMGIKADGEFYKLMKRPGWSNWNRMSERREKKLKSKAQVPAPDLYAFREYIRKDDDRGPVTPETLAKIARLGPKGGLKIRNFLRDEAMFMRWGSTHEYIGEDCWAWKSFSDPMVRLIMAKFNIKEPK